MLVTGIHCRSHSSSLEDVLSQPEDLAGICDLKTLREIGKTYHAQTASEQDVEKLKKLLLTDSSGKVLSSDDEHASVQNVIRQNIKRDFEIGNTITLKGWILSITEARQCVLLVLKNP